MHLISERIFRKKEKIVLQSIVVFSSIPSIKAMIHHNTAYIKDNYVFRRIIFLFGWSTSRRLQLNCFFASDERS